MIHVYIIICMLVLVLSAWMTTYLYQMHRRSGNSFLRHLAIYFLFFSFSLILYQIYEYIVVNCFGYDFTKLPDWYRITFYPFALITELGMARAVVGMVLDLNTNRKRRLLLIVWLSFASAGFAGYIINWITYLQSGSMLFMRKFFGYHYLALSGLILVLFISLLFQRQEKKSPFPIAAIRMFAILFIIRYTLWLGMLLLPWPSRLVAHTFLLLLTILIPFFWIRRYDIEEYVYRKMALNGERVANFSTQYALSNREQEILVLILNGKSNQEIEDALYISFNTVKNHIYRLYQKLGINSRGQLVSMVINLDKENN